ncbi:MAG: hypothetical protein J6C46_01455 [Clostridia bacterium]|nr:hypothetical protein [Clostridia bacterium]
MEIKLYNAREKLANARKHCPGMSEEVYALTDYMSEATNDTLVPYGMFLGLVMSIADVEMGIPGFHNIKELPEIFIKHKNQVLAQAPYVLQVIDAIAEKEFADEVRALAASILKFNPPKRVNAVISGYPEYIMVAVNWWANAIMSPKYDNGEEIPAMFARLAARTSHSYSQDDILVFKSTLADEIEKELKEYTTCVLDVDYGPCEALGRAGEKIGMDGMSFPWKTSMHVSKEQVTVSAGYAAPREILWSDKSKK